jgi:DNA-binding transcriptional ArsR family regulator
MSKAEIVAEIPRLSHPERREIMRRLIEVEEDAATLAECDRLAVERFQMLDAMEAEDESNAAR